MAKKAIFWPAIGAGVILALGLGWWVQNRSVLAPGSVPQSLAPVLGSGAAPAPAVDVAMVEIVKMVDDVQAVGSLRSRQSVVLRPEVSGRVTQLNFRDGERVRKGQTLVQLDDQLPLAQIQQSRAELSIASANHSRNQELVAQGFISQRSVDESAANLEVARAKLALAQASAARLKIVAPFDGIAGIRTVSVGDYLKDGADIVNLEDIEAVYVDFRLPERYQNKLRKGQFAKIDVDAMPGLSFRASIQAVDPLIDASGRSIGVRGCIDNRKLQLRPGMFARVTTVFGERDKAKVIPEEAIVPLAGKSFVVRLKSDAKGGGQVSERVEVKTGVRRPGRVEILEGLDAGDTVVTAGQQRLQRDGTQVRVMERTRPADAAAPLPAAPDLLQPGSGKGKPASTGASPNPCADRTH